MTNIGVIGKYSGISIGLGLTLMVAVFWGGMSLGTIKTNLENHEELEMHSGTTKVYVPRTEVEMQFKSMQSDIKDIKDTQRLILLELRK